MIIVHSPSPSDIEDRYGYWAVVGEIPPDFDPEGLPVDQVTAKDICREPFKFNQIRYWSGPDHEMVALIKSLHPGYPGDPDHRSTENMGRALFGV